MARRSSLSAVQRDALNMRPDMSVRATVEADETIDMIDQVWRVLSGPNLADFLNGVAHPYLENEIVQRFAHQGDRKSGHWPDLSEATEQIRAAGGFQPDWPINVRTEEMFNVLTRERDVWAAENAAEMNLPGDVDDDVARKIKTAQQGKPSPNPMSPNFGPTPPRPVLAVDEGDLAALLDMLTRWVVWEVVRGIS